MTLNRRIFLKSTMAGTSLAALGAASAAEAEQWDDACDVVVLGCGAAGLMAAIQAADGGASVRIFDKGTSPYHTSTRLNGGCFAACNSKVQISQGVKDSPEEFAANIMRYGAGMSLKAPVMTYARNSGAAFDWLQDHGLAHGFWQPYVGHDIPRTVRQDTFNGKDYIDVLVREAASRGLKIEHDCGLLAFVRDKDGRVAGVECGNAAKRIRVHARKGVVMATGGVTGRAAEVAKWSPALSDAVTIGGGSNDGAALRIAVRDLGVPITHMSFFAEYPYALTIGPGRGPQFRYQYFVEHGAILVDAEGRRFVNETLAPTQISPFMKRNAGAAMYAVMTRDVFEKTAKKYPFGALLSSPQWKRPQWEALLKERGPAASADKLADAAKAVGVNAETLEKTVAEWNEAVRQKKDASFGRAAFAEPLLKGPWIVVRINLWVCLSMGGLRVNERLQVLGWDDRPIEGLHAAGEVVGGVHGEHYLGGNACGFAHTSGYVAGRLLTGQTVSL